MQVFLNDAVQELSSDTALSKHMASRENAMFAALKAKLLLSVPEKQFFCRCSSSGMFLCLTTFEEKKKNKTLNPPETCVCVETTGYCVQALNAQDSEEGGVVLAVGLLLWGHTLKPTDPPVRPPPAVPHTRSTDVCACPSGESAPRGHQYSVPCCTSAAVFFTHSCRRFIGFQTVRMSTVIAYVENVHVSSWTRRWLCLREWRPWGKKLENFYPGPTWLWDSATV